MNVSLTKNKPVEPLKGCDVCRSSARCNVFGLVMFFGVILPEIIDLSTNQPDLMAFVIWGLFLAPSLALAYIYGRPYIQAEYVRVQHDHYHL